MTALAIKTGNAPEFSVSELAGAIKRALEDGFGYVRLRGEISGFRGAHGSGHCYFALKDDAAKIDAVIWKGVVSRLKVRPEDGLEVTVQGRVTSYPGSSKYQIVIEAMEPAGIGALMALLDERRRRLTAEGLFADDAKRPLPFMPAVVGVVTSPTGAVIRDILAGFAERFPTRVIVWPVRVQGETSGREVAAAIAGFNALPEGGALPRPDVLIVARGGGSLEDLWGYNDEAVVRAAAASTIPLVSAVGHETDWTLLDLVADARAPTPTKAAEWVVPMHSDLMGHVGLLERRLAVAMRRGLEQARAHLRSAARAMPRADQLTALPRQRFDTVEQRLGRGLLANTRGLTARAGQLAMRLHPRLLEARCSRSRDRLTALGRAKRDALLRLAVANRKRFEALAIHLRPRVLHVRFEKLDQQLDRLGQRQRDGLARLTAGRRSQFARSVGALRPQPLAQRIARGHDRADGLAARQARALCRAIEVRRQRLTTAGQLLTALGHGSVLARGYVLVRDGNGQTVRDAAQVAAGAALGLQFRDGEVRAQALAAGHAFTGDAGGLTAAPTKSTNVTRAVKTRANTAPDGTQGSLF